MKLLIRDTVLGYLGVVTYIVCRNHLEQMHSELGPAVVGSDGYLEWRRNGILHREAGPARMWNFGGREWYYRGVLIKSLGT